jgi:hypothetical protein
MIMTYLSERGRIIPPQLDDRTWQDLVDEVRALIPIYAPQWTDTNPSDPGITIIEMFAALVEGLIYRLNRVPDKHYIAFLNLLGITRNPPTPALTHLTFTAAAGAVVPAGTQAQTVATETEPAVIFETDAETTVLPINLRHATVVGPYAGAPAALTYQDKSDVLVGPPTGKFVLNLDKGQTMQICLGFDAATAAELVLPVLLFRTLQVGQVSVQLVYSANDADPHRWPAAQDPADGTEGLAHDGNIRLTMPADWQSQRPSPAGDDQPGWVAVTVAEGGTPLTEPVQWIGVRITNTTQTPITAGIDRILFNAAPARNALTLRSPELLGRSNGEPFQKFTLAHGPLLGATAASAGLAVEVGTGTPAVWEQWITVDDLAVGGGHVCRADTVTGTVMFGDFDEKTGEGHGAVPPDGAQVRARTYRYVAGGESGNVAAEQISILGTTLLGALPAGVGSVTNLGPGFDGSDEEPVDDTLLRAPDVLKTRDRAVTVEDYENLARAATTDVVTVRCLAPRTRPDGTGWTFAGLTRTPGSVYVIVVPDKGPNEARPEPSPNLIREVKEYLDQRRDLTAALTVVGPRYLPVRVTAELNVWRQAVSAGIDENQVKADTEKRINAYLHPTRGGPNGTGWEPGRPVFASELFRAIMPSENVAYIASLQLSADIPAYHYPPFKADGADNNWDATKERPFELTKNAASVRVADYETVCAATAHTITTRLTD